MILFKQIRPRLSPTLRVAHENGVACISYIQGQSPEPKVREYFYYIDHQGMGLWWSPIDVYWDKNTALQNMFKKLFGGLQEKKFLTFFFRRVRPNNTGRYEAEFPYVSLCGRERNYIRCDDQPIVFTQLVKDSEGKDLLYYAHAGDALNVEFLPDKLCMVPKTGRVYHPAPEKIYPLGLVQSKLAIELSQYFKFDKGEEHSPTHFIWNGKIYTTDNDWYKSFLTS